MNTRNIFLTILIAVLSPVWLFAQNEEDALRYSQLFNAGNSARSMSMGGAFGALGADISVLSLNPAGMAVYRRSTFSVSPTYIYDNTHTTYLGNKAYDSDSRLSLGNIGMVYAYSAGNDNGWSNFNFGFSYIKRTDFYQYMTFSAINNDHSMLDYFVDNANGKSLDQLDDYQEGLAFDTWLIDTITGQPTYYGSVLSQYGDLPNSTYGESQRRRVSMGGNHSVTNFSFAANYGYKFYIGGTFTIRTVVYSRDTRHREEDVNNEIYDFKYFDYLYSLGTHGTAFTGELGAIFRPVPALRLGAAVHFPSVYKLHDNYRSYMESGFDTPDDQGNTTYKSNSRDGYYDYKLNSPFHFVGSVAFQFKKVGLLSLDYEYVDYAGMKFRNWGDNYDFFPINQNIRDAYKGTSNIRGGAEFRLGAAFLRAGMAYYGSPYKSTELNKNASTISYSGGIGYRSGMFSIDLGYSYLTHNENYVLYPNIDDDYATTWKGRHRVTATMNFYF